MRLRTLALVITVIWAQPASAAELVSFSGGGNASYVTETFYPYWTPECGYEPCKVSTSEAQFGVNFDVIVADLSALNSPNWTYNFSYGALRGIGIFSGTVVSLGNGAFTGTNFRYAQANLCTGVGPCFSTTGSAAAFSIRQTSPPPVPEPSTWGLMLVGFGIIAGALRSAKRREKRAWLRGLTSTLAR